MVISAEPHAADPVAGGDAEAGEGVMEEAFTARQQAPALSSFASVKTWRRNRGLRCAPVNRAGDAITRRSSRMEKLDEVREDLLLLHLREVPAPGANTDTPADAGEAAIGASRPWKLRTRQRRRPATSSAAASASSPPSERRTSRARAEALDRPRFSRTLSSEEIEEDIYALTGARSRRRPRRRPRLVQRQIDRLFPGAWLTEITAETYRVPEDR